MICCTILEHCKIQKIKNIYSIMLEVENPIDMKDHKYL